jgi:hypothetical protein
VASLSCLLFPLAESGFLQFRTSHHLAGVKRGHARMIGVGLII